jgi:hypothetical protein
MLAGSSESKRTVVDLRQESVGKNWVALVNPIGCFLDLSQGSRMVGPVEHHLRRVVRLWRNLRRMFLMA